jgi:hypothetical protein
MAPSLLVAGAVIVLVAKGVPLRRPVVALNRKPRSTSFSPQTYVVGPFKSMLKYTGAP